MFMDKITTLVIDAKSEKKKKKKKKKFDNFGIGNHH
jgi:hypothetical protein